MITDWLLVLLTLVIAIFTYLVWKVYERIAWLTGAMESPSALMLRIEAQRGIRDEPIDLVWWDPTIAKPPSQAEHGKPAELNRILVFIPPEHRQNKPSTRHRLRDLFRKVVGSPDR